MLPRTLAVLTRVASFVLIATLLLPVRNASAIATTANPTAPYVYVLPSGMRVAIVEDRAAPVVQTAMWYRFGATDEREGKTGLAHAIAHMMYRGTYALSGSGLDDIFTRLGAQETATTSNDYTTFRFVVPANALEFTLRVEADRMQHLRFDEATWRTERDGLLAERDAILDQPLTRLYDRVCRSATQTKICALAALGDRSDLASATVADVRDAYRAFYTPDNATLVITGDVDRSETLALVAKTFGDIPRREHAARSNAYPRYATEQKVEIAGEFPYEVVDLAYAAPGSADPDSGAFAAIDAIVNNPRSDFHKALVRSGYTLGYSTQLDQNARGGLYHVFLIVAPGHSSAQVRNAFVDVLADMQRVGFPADLLAAAQTGATRSDLFARDAVADLGNREGYALAVDDSTDPASTTKRIVAASASDLAVAGRRYLRAPVVTGLLTPEVDRRSAALAPPTTSVTDDFSRRTPSGPIFEGRSFRNALPAVAASLGPRAIPTAFTLASGVRVLVSAVRSNPTVYVTGSVETSPAFDPPEKTGIGALVAALVSYGSARYDFDAQRKIGDDLGATLDLGTSFSARGRARDLDAILDVIAQTLIHPALAPESIEHVRKQTLAAIAERDGDPAYRAGREFERLLERPEDPTLREPTRATILSIHRSDLQAYAKRYLRPELTTISIAGDVDPQSVRTKLEAAFGTWTATGPPLQARLIPYATKTMGTRHIVTDRRLVDARVGEPAIARGDADYDVLAIINELLGGDGGYDTRLMQQLHLERPIVDSIASSLDADRYRGSLAIRFEATPGNLGRATAGIRHELERLTRDAVGPFELDRARSKIVARTLLASQSTQSLAARAHHVAIDGLPPDSDATLGARFATINGARIIRVAQRYLHPESLIEVYEGPRT